MNNIETIKAEIERLRAGIALKQRHIKELTTRINEYKTITFNSEKETVVVNGKTHNLKQK